MVGMGHVEMNRRVVNGDEGGDWITIKMNLKRTEADAKRGLGIRKGKFLNVVEDCSGGL